MKKTIVECVKCGDAFGTKNPTIKNPLCKNCRQGLKDFKEDVKRKKRLKK